MARRRTKKRTHMGANNGPAGKAVSANQTSRAPKSMVIRIGAGEVGPSVSQLVKDVRLMMEPGTASRLKERRANRLRDYLTMAGPLGVSHLLLFSRSESGNTNMRLAITPRGPTLHFNVEKYSLCKDVRKALKHPKGGAKEYLTAPLVCPLFVKSRLMLISAACHEQLYISSLRVRIQQKDT
jgi:ribosome biogenesis protein SSF1/2